MYTQLEQRGMLDPPVNVSTLREMKASGEKTDDPYPNAVRAHENPLRINMLEAVRNFL